MNDDDHDRLIRLEERVAQWMHSLEARIGVQHRTLVGIAAVLATIAAGVVVALLTRGI